MNAKEKAELLTKNSKNYNSFSCSRGIVEKTFNKGKGSLALYRFSDGNRVAANTLLETKSDRKKLFKIFPESIISEVELGYPDWYTKTLPNPDTLNERN